MAAIRNMTINWHRGRHTHTKSASYHRQRFADWQDYEYVGFHGYSSRRFPAWYVAEENVADTHDLTIGHILSHLASSISHDWQGIPEVEAQCPPHLGVPAEILPVRLAAHVQSLGVTSTRYDDWEDECNPEDFDLLDSLDGRAIASLKGLARTEAAFAARLQQDLRHLTNLIVAVVLFHPFWIRPISNWKPIKGTAAQLCRSLVDHLFVRYAVPDFLYVNWSRRRAFPRQKWIAWFILLGQGGSLRKAAPCFGWKIGRRLQKWLDQVPSNYLPMIGFIWAEVRRMGGNDRIFSFLLSESCHEEYWMDVTDESSSATDGSGNFWRGTVRWLIKHGGTLSDDQVRLILRWVRNECLDDHRLIRLGADGMVTFSWDGLGRRAVLDAATAYHTATLQGSWSKDAVVSTVWQPLGWDWTSSCDEQWSVQELCSSAELAEEGMAVHHCVGSYGQLCKEGRSAIQPQVSRQSCTHHRVRSAHDESGSA